MPDLTSPAPDFSEPPRAARSRAWLAWVVALVMLGVVALILFPVFARARAKACGNYCLSTVKSLVQADLMYAGDNDGRFPRAQDWPWQLQEYAHSQFFRCPDDGHPRVLGHFPYPLSYTMNAAANELQTRGLAPRSAAQLGVIFDGTAVYGGAAQATFRIHCGSEPVQTPPPTCALGYADGHAKYLHSGEFSDELLLPRWLTPVPLRRPKDLPPLPPGPPPRNP